MNKFQTAIVIVIVFVLTSLSLATLLVLRYYYYYQQTFEQDSVICSSQACKDNARILLDAINGDVDPCDDFYEYACGKWLARATIGDSEDAVDMFQGKAAEELLSEALSKWKPDSSRLAHLIDNAAFTYRQCQNLDEMDPNETVGIISKVIGSFGGAALFTPQWREENFDLSFFVASGATLTNEFIRAIIYGDMKNNVVRRITIVEPDNSFLDRHYLLNRNSSVYAEYRRVVYAITSALAPKSISSDAISSFVEDMLDFEAKLARLKSKADEHQIDQLLPFSSLDPILQGILRSFIRFGTPVEIPAEEDIQLIARANFWEHYTDLIRNTSNATIANFGAWILLRNPFRFALPIDIRKQFEPLLLRLGSPTPPRWKLCFNRAADQYPAAMSRFYVDQFFDKGLKAKARYDFQLVIRAFESSVNSASWLDEETRDSAIMKLQRIKLDIAYRDSILNDTMILNLYQHSPNRSLSMVENMVQLHLVFMKRMIEKWSYLKQRRARAAAYDANAYYNQYTNTLALPAYFLQQHYQSELPQSVNFAVAGFIFGHELVHAFDNVGRKFDMFGNAADWWSPNASAVFDEKAECFSSEFSKFCLDELKSEPKCVNGNLTLKENLADHGGLRATFYAYQEWREANNTDMKLPGLSHLTHDQLFFLSTAARSCSKRRPESVAWQLREDSHTPNKFRINGLMRNLAEFAHAYDCKRGSFMNPAAKCKVW